MIKKELDKRLLNPKQNSILDINKYNLAKINLFYLFKRKYFLVSTICYSKKFDINLYFLVDTKTYKFLFSNSTIISILSSSC